MSRRLFAVALVLLVAVGSWLRGHDLDRDSLWTDEVFSIALAQYHPFVPEAGHPWFRAIELREIGDGDTFLTAKGADQAPPLQELVLKASIALFGPTEIGSRAPSVLAGCALLALVAWLAWREPQAGPRRILAWALLLLALWPALVVYAREGRVYSLGVGLLGAGVIAWLRRWNGGVAAWRPPGWGEIACFAGAALSHYLAWPTAVGLLAADFVRARRTGSRTGRHRVLAALAIVLPWTLLHVHTIRHTAKGRAGWGIRWSGVEWIGHALGNALDLLQWPWLVLAMVTFVGVLWLAKVAAPTAGRSAPLDDVHPRAGWLLLGLVLLQVVLAGRMSAQAGMAHPRHFMFAIPAAAMLLAWVFAHLRHPAAVGLLVLAVVGSAWPALQRNPWTAVEDYRSMTAYAVRDAPPDTLFLHAWAPSRDHYRVGLERALGGDLRPRMVAVSTPADVAQACARLAGARHVAVLGTAMLRVRTDEVYAACGSRWPRRSAELFRGVYAERWDAAPEAPGAPGASKP